MNQTCNNVLPYQPAKYPRVRKVSVATARQYRVLWHALTHLEHHLRWLNETADFGSVCFFSACLKSNYYSITVHTRENLPARNWEASGTDRKRQPPTLVSKKLQTTTYMFRRHTSVTPNDTLGMPSCLFMRDSSVQSRAERRRMVAKHNGKRQVGNVF